MPRVPQLALDQADLSTEQRELLEQTKAQLGKVPNLYAAIANGPATLRGYLALRDSLGHGVLDARTRVKLALLIAQENGCEYCVAAHTMRGSRLFKMSAQQLLDTRHALDDDHHTEAVLRVAVIVLRSGGRIDDKAIASAREAGVTDAELMEIVGHIALNVLSNYANHLAQPDLDFPAIELEPRDEMSRSWQRADEVELVEGYVLTDAEGTETRTVRNVEISYSGGFVHIRHVGADLVQTVSAPGIRRIRQGLPTAA
ncbi:carboxymuconolactone decarboxylase family protein [Amycolatopsis carbonis]|uniref:Carboxymuconolactone decarboxylase family protein n=1 Tax=Amycolatopsis carbonis TaxID=715471 RepID=A0A9Y2MXH2_9PSEU|nr:carboxymuconolactone decarboxylase family protein [Amycolatopsis sp. 2-15]WIX80693.1 carboxymuconolactone decarboxylase family protein [Amycolatopsis sp. 2-15]